MTLKDYITPFRKWWWLILITTIMAVGSSYFVTQRQLPNYRASTTLLIGNALADPNPSGGDFVLGEQLAQTYVDLANLPQLQVSVMENLGLNNLPDYTVNHQPNTQLIKIDVTDTNPERAMAVANELANQLILRTPAAADQENIARQEFVNQELDDLQVEIRETKDRIAAKQEALAASFSAREISDLQDEISTLENKLNAMQTNYASLLASTQQGAANVISVVQQATLPKKPVGPNQRLTILATGMIGFVLATAASYLLVYLDDSIQSPEDIEKLTGLSTLSGIAQIKQLRKQEYEIITIKEPRSPISEAFRGLRTAIQFSDPDTNRRVILITSALPSEGKSSIASNLSVVLAQSGQKTLLIDADLRRPVQHKFFKIGKEPGLINLLFGINLDSAQAEKERVMNQNIIKSSVQDLYLLPSGANPPNPSELLGSVKMKDLFNFLSSHFDYVIIDSPPVMPITDAVILSTLVQSVLVVVRGGQTSQSQIKITAERLREVNANIIGVVLNGLTRNDEAYHYYYYYQNNYALEERAQAKKNGHTPENNGNSNGMSRKIPWQKQDVTDKKQ